MPKLDHKHLIVNATIENPAREGEENTILVWMSNLISAVGMKLVIGPHVHYCKADENEGITASCNIETSHASLHIWDKLDPALLRFDLYSCATFEEKIVLDYIKDEFDPIKVEWILLNRDTGIQIEKRGWC